MAIKIEKGVPIPTTSPRTALAVALKAMSVGDSILVDKKEQTNIHHLARYQRMRVKTRADGEKLRVWRIE